MKKREIISKNYLERIPFHSDKIKWDADEKGMVSLHIENKGIVKKLTQVILGKPPVSHIHLDQTGSFIWSLIDGKRNIIEIGKAVENCFGETAEPVYERLSKYFHILYSYGFIEWKSE